MTKNFIYASLVLGLISLAVGWILASYWVVGISLLVMAGLSLVLVIRKFRPALSLVLFVTVLTAAVGLWVGVSLSLALTAVICILAAWDLDGFAQRLAFAAEEDNPQQVERQHLWQINLALLIAVGITLITQSIHYHFGFEWALVMAILAFYGIGALINGMRAQER